MTEETEETEEDFEARLTAVEARDAKRLLGRLKYIAVVLTCVLIILVIGAWVNHQLAVRNHTQSIINGKTSCEIVRGDHLPDPGRLCVVKKGK